MTVVAALLVAAWLQSFAASALQSVVVAEHPLDGHDAQSSHELLLVSLIASLAAGEASLVAVLLLLPRPAHDIIARAMTAMIAVFFMFVSFVRLLNIH
jgi:hypothetical protein